MNNELWDIYDRNMNLTGNTYSDGEKLPDGYYGLLVHIIIRNKQNEYLLQQRAFTKKWYPGQWDNTCGRVQAGETALQGAMREVYEELGLKTNPEQYTQLYKKVYKKSCILAVFLLNIDFALSDCVLQKSEVAQIKNVKKEEMIEILEKSKDKEYMDVLKRC